MNAGKYGLDVGDYAILRTDSHELTHFISENSTVQYKALRDFMVSKLTGFEGKSIEDLVAAKQANSKRTELSYEAALDEVIADGCEMMLKDSAAVEALARENKSLFNSVKNFIKNFVNAVKKAFQGVEANTEEAKAILRYADELQKIWDDALVQAARNYNASGEPKKGNAVSLSDADIKFDERKSFSEQVDAVKNGTFDTKRNQFILVSNHTPEIVTQFSEMSDLPLIISYETLYLAINESGTLKGHYHNIDAWIMKRLPEIMKNPDRILRLENGRINEIVEMATPKGNKAVISIEFDTVKKVNNKHGNYNLVITVFGAKSNYISNLIQKSEVLYSKEAGSQVRDRLYEYPTAVNESTSTDSIPGNSENVNKKFQDRTTPEYTNRQILVNALEHAENLSAADQNRLKIYKKDLDKYNDIETQLSEVSRQIHDIAFTKGTDRTQLKPLYKKADAFRSMLSAADKRLLQIEAMEPIKKILDTRNSFRNQFCLLSIYSGRKRQLCKL